MTGGPPPIGLRRVDHRLALQRLRADELQQLGRHLPRDRQHDDIAEGRRVGEGLDGQARMLRGKLLELRRLARADRDLMAMLPKPRRQRLSDHARPDHANLHVVLRQAHPPTVRLSSRGQVGRPEHLRKAVIGLRHTLAAPCGLDCPEVSRFESGPAVLMIYGSPHLKGSGPLELGAAAAVLGIRKRPEPPVRKLVVR